MVICHIRWNRTAINAEQRPARPAAALRDAWRCGFTGYEDGTESHMDRITQIVARDTLGLIDMSKADFDVLVYPSFGDIDGEAFVDAKGNGTYDPGETFADTNGNGVWDSDIGVPGPGGPGDVVVYRITYNWQAVRPSAAALVGNSGTFPIHASLAVRNELRDASASNEREGVDDPPPAETGRRRGNAPPAGAQ